MATQAHPELKSRPTRPHPLFAGFVGAALEYNAADRLPVDVDPTPRVDSGLNGGSTVKTATGR